MKKALVLAAALAITSSVADSQSIRQFQKHPPISEKACAYDSSLVGWRNALKVTGGNREVAARYGKFIDGLLKFFDGFDSGREICRMAMDGRVLAGSVGGVDYTLVQAVDERIFDCENFVISMFDMASKKGKTPFVNFVDGHVIIEIDGWCAEVNGATGDRKNYPVSRIGKMYDTVYLRTCDGGVLDVFMHMRLAAQSNLAGDPESELRHYCDAINASHGSLPEPYKGAYDAAKRMGLESGEFSRKYSAITGHHPGGTRLVGIKIN